MPHVVMDGPASIEEFYQLGLYIHIPFCVRKCAYCDFVSYTGENHTIPRYFDALQQEFTWYVDKDLFSEYDLSTMYVGGGTPSLATPELMRFLRWYQDIFFSAPPGEVTIEVNPGTITFPQLYELQQAGFNRVSLGVQSLSDAELNILGRIHTREEAMTSIYEARQANFQNISVDLIFGIPGSDLAQWESTLIQVIALKPEHISIYNLTLEAGTPFWEQQQQGRLSLPDEELQLEMYTLGIGMLSKAGYEHYEISNFALPGYRSQHNQIYWNNAEYLGLGAGAHSYLKGSRYWNTTELDVYIAQTSLHALPDCYPPTVAGNECLDLPGTIGETVMMNLRLLEGIDLKTFRRRFGQTLESVYSIPLEKLRSLDLIQFQDDHLRLTPRGLLLSNEVFQEFVNI